MATNFIKSKDLFGLLTVLEVQSPKLIGSIGLASDEVADGSTFIVL